MSLFYRKQLIENSIIQIFSKHPFIKINFYLENLYFPYF